MSETLLPIDKIARISGIPSSTIRYYERCGLIDNVEKKSGRRHYPPPILEQLSLIRSCQSVGFSLAEIRDLLTGPLRTDGAWRLVAQNRRQQIEDQIQRLSQLVMLLNATLSCECTQISNCQSMGELTRDAPEKPVNPRVGWN